MEVNIIESIRYKNNIVKNILGVFVFSFIITSCSNTKPSKSPIEFNDDTQGPGLFSGHNGGFYLYRKKIKEPKAEMQHSKSHNERDLKEASDKLDKQIQRLHKDKIELERLKEKIDRKLAE